MIENYNDFENTFNSVFGNIDRETLALIDHNRLRVELGEEKEGENRIKQAIERSTNILKYCFKNKEMFLRIVLWNSDAKIILKDILLDVDNTFERDSTNDDENILYVFMKKYKENIGIFISTLIVHYDLALDPSANITCYFVNFDTPIIINIYDDRGMDIYSPNLHFMDNLSKTYSNWII